MASSQPQSAHLRTILRQLPTSPGVYVMRGTDRHVLYVGKANSLRNRVRNLLRGGGQEEPRHAKLIADMTDIEYIVTDTVGEAFLLECNLIKEHRPRFNIRLRDDKSYPFVKITLGEDFPRIVRTRKLSRDGSRYFGPYASASSVDETLGLLRKIFPFRTCNLEIPEGKRVLERPCLLYYIKRCQGPCIQAIEKGPYRATIDHVVDFLEGRQEGIADELRSEMEGHSSALRYEQAAVARDKLKAVERTIEQQKVAAFSRDEHDVIGLAREESEACLQVFVIRTGKMIGREHFIVEGAGDATDGEMLGSFLEQYYATTERPPRSVLLPEPPDDRRPGYLPPERRGSGVQLRVPERGAKRQLVAFATENAVEALSRDRAEWLAEPRSADGGARRPDQGAGPVRPAPADRVLRHEQHPGHERSRQHGRVHRWGARSTGVPAVPDSIRRDAGRLPDDGRGDPSSILAGVPIACGDGRSSRRRWEPRTTRRMRTGRCPTSSSWTAARASCPPRSVSCATWTWARCRSPGWRSGSRNCSSRAARTRSSSRPAPGAVPRPAHSRRGPSVRDHVSPQRPRPTCAQQRVRRGAGIGPVRQTALLRRFGSVRALHDASVDEIAAAPLMSQALAERLKSALAREGRLA